MSLGVKLAAVAAPLFLDLMLLNECENWAAEAEAHGAAKYLAPALLLELRSARGVALRFARADNERTLRALSSALQVAERLDDAEYQLRLTEGLFVSLYRTGDAKGARAYAMRARNTAGTAAIVGATLPVEWMLGLLDNTMGRYAEARRHLETAIRDLPRKRRLEVLRFGIDQRVFALCHYEQVLWTVGFPDQAIAVVDRTMAEIEELGHPVILCNAYSWTFPVLLRAGLLDRAQHHAEALAELAPKHFLVPFQSVSQCYLGKLATLRGDFDFGLKMLSVGLRALEGDRNMVIDFTTRIDFAEALVDAGRHQLALDHASEIIEEIERTDVKNYWSEIWRIRGLALAGRSEDDWPEADAAFRTALGIGQAQGARSWTLRAATDYATHLARTDRISEALRLTKHALGPFTEGFETKDLQRARSLVRALEDTSGSDG